MLSGSKLEKVQESKTNDEIEEIVPHERIEGKTRKYSPLVLLTREMSTDRCIMICLLE